MIVHEFLERHQRLFVLAQALLPESLAFSGGDPQRQFVDGRCLRGFGQFGGVVSDPVPIAFQTLQSRQQHFLSIS